MLFLMKSFARVYFLVLPGHIPTQNLGMLPPPPPPPPPPPRCRLSTVEAVQYIGGCSVHWDNNICIVGA